MNERIQELSHKAHMKAVLLANDLTGEHHCRIGSDYFLALKEKKFAELIVRECASLAYDGPGGILEHFGVENDKY